MRATEHDLRRVIAIYDRLVILSLASYAASIFHLLWGAA